MRLAPKLLAPMILLAAVAAGMAVVGYSSVGHIIGLAASVNDAESQ